ncbi:MAG: cytochrome-c peroxidase, partial [Blastocatellia bacterium]
MKSSARGARRIKFVIAALFAVALAGGGLWFYRQREAGGAALTTPEITAIAKTTPPEDRPSWLRLARATISAEAVRKLAAPEEPVNNRGEAARVELGYRLFFDPILSGDRATSCASCHHPNYGMADGLKRGVGVGGRGYGARREGTGRELQRNTPSVFNVAYSPILFWDGRAGSLEEQAVSPIF